MTGQRECHKREWFDFACKSPSDLFMQYLRNKNSFFEKETTNFKRILVYPSSSIVWWFYSRMIDFLFRKRSFQSRLCNHQVNEHKLWWQSSNVDCLSCWCRAHPVLLSLYLTCNLFLVNGQTFWYGRVSSFTSSVILIPTLFVITGHSHPQIVYLLLPVLRWQTWRE